MTEDSKDSPIVNLERVQEALAVYKFPLFLAGAGAVLTVIALALLINPESKGDGIVFSTEASTSAGRRIKVDIEGSVVKPGVYEFDDEGRISDAISAAGGLNDEADITWIEKNMNKAAKLIDGGKIYIPANGETGFSTSAKATADGQNSGSNLLGVTTGLININSASQTDLESLPGVGPVTAGKIIDGRPYQTIEELKSKKALGNALFDKIKDKLTL